MHGLIKMDFFGNTHSRENATRSLHDKNRKRLWTIQTDDDDSQSDESEARDCIPSILPLDRVVALARSSSDESRDLSNVDDYDVTLFEYESLAYFNLPRPSPDEVIIAVQAATISSLKMNVQKEVTIDNVALDLDSGIAIVGVVREIGESVDRKKIQVGDRVATVLKSVMKNARYAQVSADMVVQVPYGLDSAEVAATAYTYLLAFQTLTHGIMSPMVCYSTNLFCEKNILIMDGASTSGQAMIQIAICLGAKRVFATGPDSRQEVSRMLGAIPLQEDPKDWTPNIKGRIHVVVDNVLAKSSECRAAQKVLVKEGGRIVYFGMPITMDSLKYGSVDSWKCLFQQFLAQISLMFMSSTDATYYDLFTNLERYPEKLKVCFILCL